jgi:diguanylate cyclase (GGDEF)-like protein
MGPDHEKGSPATQGTMKIRAKLLLALVAVSLVSPTAAYVSLINNPRISFALRMNEYEAQQGNTAGQLQSDLRAIESAVEESLSETYRIKVEPKQRVDADRQRRLANSAVQAGVAAFEKHLDTLAQSTERQARETSAVGQPQDAIDLHQTELLKNLRESLPDLKSNSEKFRKLSDTFSPAEGDFVQQIFEPEEREKLGKIVQELATGANRGAERDRRNIEMALQHAYKESLLVVLFGVAMSAVLAVVISRTVIGPIQKLRDAAHLIGQGKMDTRIVLRSRDELGELAGSFNLMADDLTKLMEERGQAQSELTRAHERLKYSMGELESRNREAASLSEMADLLQSCFTLEEASAVIASSAQKLFHGFSGALLVFAASRNVLEAVTTWGPSSPAERVFSPNDCWALRRGRLHHSGGGDGAAHCSHFGGSLLPSLCTPLMAHGETLGILCLVTEPNGTVGLQTTISEFTVKLAVSVAEQAALSFANLKLREKLRYQSVRDPLTGLFNRRYLDESLERELPNATRKNQSLGVIMLDVDRFKRFNDMFGHDAGDTVLRELGDYLAKFVRRGDLACRYGGEEFTLILPECSLEDTRRRAEELRTSFQQLSIKHRDTVLGKVTLSLGVAVLPDHGTTAVELLAAADGALLRAKEEGRDRVLIAEVSPNRSI